MSLNYELSVPDFTHFQKGFLFLSPPHNFAKFYFHQQMYENCFYTGLRFYEAFSQKEIHKICHDGPYAMPNGSYTASSDGTLIIAHMCFTGSINVLLEAQLSSCRGIFINFCSSQVYPSTFVSIKKIQATFCTEPYCVPVSNISKKLNKEGDCLEFQFGHRHLSGNSQPHLGECMLLFYFVENTNEDQANTRLSIGLEFVKYVGLEFTANLQQPVGDLFFTMNKMQNLSQSNSKCEERFLHPSNFEINNVLDKFRGKRMLTNFFNFVYQLPRNTKSFSSQSFQTEILFHCHNPLRHNDVFFLKEFGFSSHLRVLKIFRKKGREKTVSCESEAGQTHLKNQPSSENICLKESFRKYVMPDSILLLSTQGLESTCTVGMMIFDVNLCLGFCWFSRFLGNIGPQYTNLRMCTSAAHHCIYGQEKIVWSSELTSDMLQSTCDLVKVDLPGKVFRAMLSSSDKCCRTTNCFLRFSWSYPRKGSRVPLYLRLHGAKKHAEWRVKALKKLRTGHKYSVQFPTNQRER